MTQSMTGFGSKEAQVEPFGKICAELRSSNHKFLEIVLHLPEGFPFLEDKIKKEIGAKIKRGRITFAVNIVGSQASRIFINKGLLRNYIRAINDTKQKLGIKSDASLDTLLHLPGVLSQGENLAIKSGIWPRLKKLVGQATDELVKMRRKEGAALCVFLKKQTEALKADLGVISARFKKVTQDRITRIKSEDERAGFLKDTDITEEMERLAFHIRNFSHTLAKAGPVGKELDFITQEMQREANTIGAKSFDTLISGCVVKVKSQIEKMREQLQNIE